MKKRILKYTTILLAFLAGIAFMNYATFMGNHDMTEVMAEATLPVAYAERDGQLYNEMHGYVETMDGSYMKDSVIGLFEDHQLSLALEKFNAQIEEVSYEVRSLDMSRLIESGENLTGEDDGKYLRFSLDLKDLLEKGEKYLFLLKVKMDGQEEVTFYSLISFLGENHVQECVDFALEFHDMTVNKETDHAYLSYLEPNSTMDGKNLGYVNIHSRSGPITWGDMPIEQVSDTELTFTEFDGDVTSLVLDYQVRNTQTDETYQVSEAFRVRYTTTRMYLLAYERTADRIFTVDRQIVDDGEILFGIQSKEPNYRKNNDESVVAFVQQGQLWCYDFGKNQLSKVYGFQDGADERGFYDAHDFRLIQVQDSGSMDFLVYGYMNRGRYEGMSGVLLCHYDALMNTVEEQFFLPGDRPYEALKEDIGKLAVENDDGMAWISYRGMILQVNLSDCSVQVLAENIQEDWLQVTENGLLAAWTDQSGDTISLLDTNTGGVNRIRAEEGETLQALGFMEEDFIYGIAYQENIGVDAAGRRVVPMHRVVIRDHSGNEVREFDYEAKGKYVTEVSIVENRINLACVMRTEDGSYEKTLPEPITYTSEPVTEKLKMEVASDDIKRNEYRLTYTGNIKSGSIKQPKVKLVLFERSRTLVLPAKGLEQYLAYSFDGKAKGFDALAEAVVCAHDGMGSVWKDGCRCFWERGGRLTRVQLSGFDELETMEDGGSSMAQCLQLLLRQKQIYTDVETSLAEGMSVPQIMEKELGDSACLLPDCSLTMVLYYVSCGAPVMAMSDTGDYVLIVGYDAQNITYYEPGKTTLTKAGQKDSAAMFESAGNMFFTYLP